MTDLFRTPEDYELFLNTLTDRFPSLHRSTLTFIRRGHSLARVSGEVFSLTRSASLSSNDSSLIACRF